MNPHGRVLFAGPWLGSVAHELGAWIPKLRLALRTKIRADYVVVLGFPGRDAFYRGLAHEYVVMGPRTIASLGASIGGYARTLDQHAVVDFRTVLEPVVHRWAQEQQVPLARLRTCTPEDVEAIVGEGCVRAQDLAAPSPAGDYRFMHASAQAVARARSVLGQPQKPVVAVCPQRTHGQCAPYWAPLMQKLAENARYHFVQGSNFETADDRLALLGMASAVLTDSVDDAYLAFMTRCPTVAFQPLPDAWRLDLPWQRELTLNHRKVRIVARGSCAQQQAAWPSDDLAQAALSFLDLHVDPGPHTRAALSLTRLGRTLLHAGDVEAALSAVEAALAQEPELAMAHHALGQVHCAAKRFPQALHHYRLALSLDPDDRDVALDCGRLLRQLGRSDMASGFFRTWAWRNRSDHEASALQLNRAA